MPSENKCEICLNKWVNSFVMCGYCPYYKRLDCGYTILDKIESHNPDGSPRFFGHGLTAGIELNKTRWKSRTKILGVTEKGFDQEGKNMFDPSASPMLHNEKEKKYYKGVNIIKPITFIEQAQSKFLGGKNVEIKRSGFGGKIKSKPYNRVNLTHAQQIIMGYPSALAKSQGIRKRYYNSFLKSRYIPAEILHNNSFWLKVDYRKYPKSKDAKVKKIRLVNYYTIDKENVKRMVKKIFSGINKIDYRDCYFDYVLYQDGKSWEAGLSSMRVMGEFEQEAFNLYGIDLNKFFSLRKDYTYFFTR